METFDRDRSHILSTAGLNHLEVRAVNGTSRNVTAVAAFTSNPREGNIVYTPVFSHTAVHWIVVAILHVKCKSMSPDLVTRVTCF